MERKLFYPEKVSATFSPKSVSISPPDPDEGGAAILNPEIEEQGFPFVDSLNPRIANQAWEIAGEIRDLSLAEKIARIKSIQRDGTIENREDVIRYVLLFLPDTFW